MKKGFTLIELIVVIAVLGILASVIVPNISNIQGKATEVSVQADVRSLQTVVDMYQLEHDGGLPTLSDPTVLQASELDFSKVYPEYLRSLPKNKGIKYWVDVTGLIWSSETDMPVLSSTDSSSLSWEQNQEATGYVVYEIVNNKSTSNTNLSNISYKEVQRISDTLNTSYTGDSTKQYAVATLDRLNRSSAPIGVANYAGYTDTLESIKKGQSNQTPPVVEQKGVAKAYIGGFASFTLMNNGTVFASGDSSSAQLGLGSRTGQTSPTLIPNLSGVKEITVPYGQAAYFALLDNGTVKSWGYNGYRLLGFSDSTDRLSPEIISELSNVKKIYSNSRSIYALLNNGTVMVWGENANGQLGLGDNNKRVAPVLIPNLEHVKELFVSSYNSVYALLEDGTVKSWGSNTHSSLGLGDTQSKNIPTTIIGLNNVKTILAAENQTVFAQLKDGTVVSWGDNSTGKLGLGDIVDHTTPTVVPELKNAVNISIRNSTGFAVFSDGTVKIWGYDNYGLTGSIQTLLTPTTYSSLTNVKEIVTSTSADSYFAILKDGTVKSWGQNVNGTLGLGDTTNRQTPTIISNLSNVNSIQSTDGSTMAVLNDGTVKVWGANFVGQLGLGDTMDRTTPVVKTLD